MCDYVNQNWGRSALHLAAYVLWRINWIHPFADGNGRTARAVSYILLSIKLDSLLPGTKTIPDQIAADKKPYYAALEPQTRRGNRDAKLMSLS
jgi:Fic family protein